MDAYPAVSVRLYLLDRFVNLIDEGIDVALRIAHLADSSLVATGSARFAGLWRRRRGISCQNPRDHGAGGSCKASDHHIYRPWDRLLELSTTRGSSVARIVHFTPRLIVNSIRGAIASAVNGRGVTRVFSYHIPQQVREGSLEIVLKDHEPPPLPVHLIAPQGRLSVPKVRAFVDLALPRLRSHFAHASRPTG